MLGVKHELEDVDGDDGGEGSEAAAASTVAKSASRRASVPSTFAKSADAEGILA